MLLVRKYLIAVAFTVCLSIISTLAVSTSAQATGTVSRKLTQADLVVSSDSMPVVRGLVILNISGGSGTGKLTYKLAVENSECHIRGNVLKTYVTTTCWVYAAKAADAQYLMKRSLSVQFIFRLPQSTLRLSVLNSATLNQPVTAQVTGGSGDGAVSLQLVQPNNMCQIVELTLTITGSGACKIVAHKDGDSSYVPVDSEPATVDTRPEYPWLNRPRLYVHLGASAPYPGLELTVLEGGWSLDTYPESFGYRWLRDEQTISGANTRNYIVTSDDIGHRLTAEVTINNHLYASKVWRADATLPTLRLLNSSIPQIQGSKVAGKRLTALPGRWVAGATLTYQWFRDATLVPDAHGRQYKLTAQDINHDLQVLVTGTKPGYKTVSRLSQGTWQPQQQQVYASISSLANTANPNAIPVIHITAAPGVDPQWLARESVSIQRSVNLFPGFRQPATVDVIYVTGQDIDWAEQLFTDRGYQIYQGIRWWMQRDDCNIALSWTERQHPVFIQCLGPGRDNPMYQQIGAHEYAHLVQGQYSLAHSVMPGWLTEGSASFYGIASAVYDRGLDMNGVDTYLATYASSNYSYDVAAQLPQGSQALLHLMQDGDVSMLMQLLDWSSGSGLLYVHTQFLFGGLLTEWLISTYGLAKMQELYATVDQDLTAYLPVTWADRRARGQQAFKTVYGSELSELLLAATPYLSARANQLLEVSPVTPGH